MNEREAVKHAAQLLLRHRHGTGKATLAEVIGAVRDIVNLFGARWHTGVADELYAIERTIGEAGVTA